VARYIERRWIAASVTALVAVPALADLLSGIRTAPFRWLAADVFYYLTVARNVARTGRFTFDGERAVNGYHPLWQVCVALLELLRLRAHLGDVGPFLIVLGSVVAVAAGVWILALTFLRERRSTPLLLLLPTGVYPLLVLPLWIYGLALIVSAKRPTWMLPVFGTPWSYMNGMESGVTILFFALSLSLTTSRKARSSARGGALAGAALAGFTLARLDHGIIAVAMLAGFALSVARARTPGRSAAVAGAALSFTLVLAPYLGCNRLVFGRFMPTSGAAKTSFPELTSDHVERIRQLFTGKLATSPWWLPVACREAQIVLPAILSLIYLAVRATRRRPATALDWMLASAAMGALGLAAYNFCFGLYWGQGYWYFPVSTLLPTLFVAAERWPQISWARPTWGSPPFPRARRRRAVVLAAVFTVAFFLTLHRHETYGAEFATFYTSTAKEVRAAYPAGLPKFVEADDGIISYALDAQGESHVFALDPEGFAARKEHRLADLSYTRGFRHLASFQYRPRNGSPAGLRGWAAGELDQPMDRYLVEREYVSADGTFFLVRFKAQ
jgi:hypothetical protein